MGKYYIPTFDCTPAYVHWWNYLSDLEYEFLIEYATNRQMYKSDVYNIFKNILK